MNTQEYSEKIAKLERESDEILKEIRELKALYLAAAPFQPGDRVIVEYNGVKSFAFVSHIEINWLSKDHEYVFNKQKNDGTQSKIRAYLGLSPKIEHAPK